MNECNKYFLVEILRVGVAAYRRGATDNVLTLCIWIITLSNVCKSSISSLQAREIFANEVDRKQNNVVFGVSEDRNPSIWCQEVEAILGTLESRYVGVVDMFRLGCFFQAKIVLYLRSCTLSGTNVSFRVTVVC